MRTHAFKKIMTNMPWVIKNRKLSTSTAAVQPTSNIFHDYFITSCHEKSGYAINKLLALKYKIESVKIFKQ